MRLRDYQEKAVEQIRDSIRQGKNRPILAAPCAMGKTVIAAHIMKGCQDKGKRGFFFVDRTQLVEQSIVAFRAAGINFGVRQANHPLTNPMAPIQIASIQTIDRMVGEHGKRLPEFELALVDEAHTQYRVIDKFIEAYDRVPIIGLTATPYSKGLGTKYNNLLVPITAAELQSRGYLCPVKYYAGASIDLSNVRKTDPNTYSFQDLEKESDRQHTSLVGNVIKNWFEYGENSQTIAFSPSQAMSKGLVNRFRKAGVTAEHIDCHMKQEDRQALYEAHDRGEFKVLSCCKLLNTGYDAPSVKCIVDCYPVASLISWVQRAGRLMRTSEGKDHAIYLDHASNYSRFGPAKDVVPEYLDDGEKTYRETDLAKEKEEIEKKSRECPDCSQLITGRACDGDDGCGWTMPEEERQADDNRMLVEMQELEQKELKKLNSADTVENKTRFLSELLKYGKDKNYKSGWAPNKYRSRYGVWPNAIKPYSAKEIGEDTMGWIRHANIKYANRKTA